MVGHQAERIDLDAEGILQRAQIGQITLEIGVLNKHNLPVVTPLHNVMRVVWQQNPTRLTLGMVSPSMKIYNALSIPKGL